jgi:hypothetical protein
VIDSSLFSERLIISRQESGHLLRELTLPPGDSLVNFTCDGQPFDVSGTNDTRTMVFRIFNASLREHD